VKRILIPLDGTYLSQKAARYAVILAKRWDLSVELFHCATPGASGWAPAVERAGLL